jgi:hypothetical protein
MRLFTGAIKQKLTAAFMAARLAHHQKLLFLAQLANPTMPLPKLAVYQ